MLALGLLGERGVKQVTTGEVKLSAFLVPLLHLCVLLPQICVIALGTDNYHQLRLVGHAQKLISATGASVLRASERMVPGAATCFNVLINYFAVFVKRGQSSSPWVGTS